MDFEGFAAEDGKKSLLARLNEAQDAAAEWVSRKIVDPIHNVYAKYHDGVARKNSVDGSDDLITSQHNSDEQIRENSKNFAKEGAKTGIEWATGKVLGVVVGATKGLQNSKACVTLENATGKAINKLKGLFKGSVIEEGSEAAAEFEKAAEKIHSLPLQPYKEGAGHHIPAKKMFEGAQGYDPKTALAVPKKVLDQLKARHGTITGAQITLYRSFSKTGKGLTWEIIEEIETKALIKGGINKEVAMNTVKEVTQKLKDAGISPTKIPWGGQ